MTKAEFAGKTVVITGASMGIGEAFAQALAQRGARLVLVARSRDRLAALAKALADRGSEPLVVVEDLASPGAARRVFDAVTAHGWDVDLLINNAGVGLHSPFASAALDVHREAVALNVAAVVELTHVFLPMIERRQGGIINVASTAAFQPVPYMAVYGASKAFVLSFSEALWGEYRDRGVRVLALCPGATDTPFFARAGEAAAVGKKVTPASLVERGLAAYLGGRPTVVHGLGNALTALSTRFAPRAMVAKISAKLMRPRSPQLSATPAAK